MIEDLNEKVSIMINDLVKNENVLVDMFNPHYKT